jgi:hypothetical protein
MANAYEKNCRPDKGEVVLYQSADGKAALDVRLDGETLWLNLNQLAELFERDKSVISRHLRNIYNTSELYRESTVAFFATVQDEGARKVERRIEYFNLDAIISVGYRVNSKRGTQFRIWTTNVLRERLVLGFSLNEKRLREQEQKLADLCRAVGVLERTLVNQAIGLDEAKGLLQVITDYAYALTTLDRFDRGTLAIKHVTRPAPYTMTYDDRQERSGGQSNHGQTDRQHDQYPELEQSSE